MTLPTFTAGEDLRGWLERYERLQLLRVLTCGNVDDGKSTLIGRLLHDTGRIYEDHLRALEADSRVHGTTGGGLDLALVVDGLKAEREQGITIDVAWRYFTTARRAFIIADCPGHEQYTRNMATGASHCQLAISLIDARSGVTTQTRRHATIAAMLGIRHVVAAVNKMDLVGWGEQRFREIESEFLGFCSRLGIEHAVALPVSALTGEGVVRRSGAMPWFSGPALLDLLEGVELPGPRPDDPFRMPVQVVLRPNLDFRGFAGQVTSGDVRVGDRIRIMPRGTEARIARIARPDEFGGDVQAAQAPESVVLCLDREVDCSRGDVIACFGGTSDMRVGRRIVADLVWMVDAPLVAGQSLLCRVGTRITPARVLRVIHRLQVDTLAHEPADAMGLNDIGRVELECEEPVAFDPYRVSRGTGALVLIDRLTNATAAAGMIRTGDATERGAHWDDQAPSTVSAPVSTVSDAERDARWSQRPCCVLLHGPPNTGKTEAAFALERALWDLGHDVVVLDGQGMRSG
ncbi:MAG: Bifunctional enzyme CysN/CysC, partial [Planctomycetota bacterium]